MLPRGCGSCFKEVRDHYSFQLITSDSNESSALESSAEFPDTLKVFVVDKVNNPSFNPTIKFVSSDACVKYHRQRLTGI